MYESGRQIFPVFATLIFDGANAMRLTLGEHESGETHNSGKLGISFADRARQVGTIPHVGPRPVALVGGTDSWSPDEIPLRAQAC